MTAGPFDVDNSQPTILKKSDLTPAESAAGEGAAAVSPAVEVQPAAK
jgi:hypothetical protein